MYLLDSLVLLLLTTVVLSSKYSEKANTERERPFRLNKHNILWEQAQKNHLSPQQMGNLRVELKKLDKISLELKHAKEEHRDQMGDLAAEARERFIEITEKYGLVNNEVDSKEYANQKKFNHAKVKNLWEKALYEGSFDQDELDQLKKELEHHEDKIKEYHLLSEMIDRHDEVSDNDIASLDRPSQSEMKKKKKELKDKYHDINRHYATLNDKVQRKMPSPVEAFRDGRVLDLWRKANRMNFTEDELESIQEELKHFQIRIDKHNHWKEEHDKLIQDKKEQNHHEVDNVAKKVQEHGKLVKKYHATMVDRVFKRDEL